MASDEEYEIPDSGAVFTFGRSAFADNQPSHFFIRNDPVVEISCGDEHTAVVCQNGRVFLFGQNDYGQLGLGHTRTVPKPSCLKGLKPFHSNHVACGKGHTLVSTRCGRLFSFGLNSDGQLGTGDATDSRVPRPVKADAFRGAAVVSVAAGCLHSACLLENGDLYVWGSNSDGQCGAKPSEASLPVPTKIEFERPIAAISCGYYHTAFISERELYTFGEEDGGKLGYRKHSGRNSPIKVDLPFPCAKVECGGNHTLLLSDEGRVFGIGSNFSGQLGSRGTLSESYTPLPLDLDGEAKVVSLSAGESHSAFITEDGTLYTCGDGRYGKTCFEDGDAGNVSSPAPVGLSERFNCLAVSCGGCQTMIIAKGRSGSGDYPYWERSKFTPPLQAGGSSGESPTPDGSAELERRLRLRRPEPAAGADGIPSDFDGDSALPSEGPLDSRETYAASRTFSATDPRTDQTLRYGGRIARMLTLLKKRTTAAVVSPEETGKVTELANISCDKEEEAPGSNVDPSHGMKKSVACAVL